jgi:hypothetical protein
MAQKAGSMGTVRLLFSALNEVRIPVVVQPAGIDPVRRLSLRRMEMILLFPQETMFSGIGPVQLIIAARVQR